MCNNHAIFASSNKQIEAWDADIIRTLSQSTLQI